MWMCQETLLQTFVKYGVNLTFFCTLVTIAMATILIFFNPQKAAAHYGGYSYKVPWSLMQGIQKYFKSALFCFHDNCGKVCPTNSDFFGLSHSTRCGCCSYQVSSIYIRLVTCYDQFCVFQFFSILAVSMATAAILKKNTCQHNFTWHMVFLQGFIQFDQGISEKSSGQKCVEE